jgi:hypothetical protein
MAYESNRDRETSRDLSRFTRRAAAQVQLGCVFCYNGLREIAALLASSTTGRRRTLDFAIIGSLVRPGRPKP